MAELLIVFIGAGLVLGAGAWIEQRLWPRPEMHADDQMGESNSR